MGIVSKAHTAKRTSAKAYPNNFGDARERLWRTKRLLQTTALMFGAPTMTSTTLRGHNSSLAPLFGIGEVTSDFWFERVKPTKWQLSLGAGTTRGIVWDWAVTVELAGTDESPQIALNTVSALTRDGVLEKGKLHDSLRQLIGNAATTGQQPEVPPAFLTEILRSSYATPVHRIIDAAPPQFVEDFVIHSPASFAEVHSVIAMCRHRVIERTDERVIFEVGLEGYPSGTVVLSIRARNDRLDVQGEVTFHASGSAVVDAVAFRMCKSFASDLMGLFKLFDVPATLEEPG